MHAQTSTELLNAIYGRRAVRKYAADQLSQSELERLIVIATQAPSAMNLQPWAFAVVWGADRLKEYSECAKSYLLAGSGPLAEHAGTLAPDVNIFHNAPVLVVICATGDDEQAAEDCCLAAQTFMLAAFWFGLRNLSDRLLAAVASPRRHQA